MPEADKVALKGFCGARYWPITVNNATTFTTAAMVAFIGSRNLTKDENRSDYNIPGDDGIYDICSDYNYEDMEFEVDELPLSMQSQLKGGTYDEETKSYTFAKGDQAIYFAYGYAALMACGKYRMWKLYCCKVTKITVTHKTHEEGDKDAQTYKIAFRNTYREADGRVEMIQESTDQTYDWLNTIDNLPVTGGGS